MAQWNTCWPADLVVPSSIPEGGILSNYKQSSIVHSLLLSLSYCSDMTEKIYETDIREYARGRRERRNRLRPADVAFFSSESDKNVALISRKIRCFNIHFNIHTCHQLVFDLGRSSTRYLSGLHKKSIPGRGPVWEGS